jgi:hypothetical protein
MTSNCEDKAGATQIAEVDEPSLHVATGGRSKNLIMVEPLNVEKETQVAL